MFGPASYIQYFISAPPFYNFCFHHVWPLLHTFNILFQKCAPLRFLAPLPRNPGDGPEWMKGKEKNG